MATVRFSDKLKDEIERKAKDIFAKELNDIRADIPATWSAEYLYNTVFPKDIRDKMDALPDKYLKQTSRLNLCGFKDIPEGESNAFWGLKTDVRLAFAEPKPIPEGSEHPEFYMGWRGVSLNYNTPRFATIRAEFKVWRDKQMVVRDKREVFIDGIKQIMNTYSTLGPALKVFPALWDLVPSEYQERHMKVTKRKRGDAKELGDLDVNNLTATVTLNKLTR